MEAADRSLAPAAGRARNAAPSSDEEMMAAVRARADEGAFDRLVRRHGERALRAARACLGGSGGAEDAVQECFLHMVRARRSYRPGAPFAPWFYTLLRNACRDELRRRSRRPETRPEPPERPAGTDPCDQLVAREDARAACRAFAGLPPEDREILALRVHGGLEFPEVARITGLSAECAKKRAYRALDRLRRELAPQS